jgi:hypothetical protein
MGILAALRTGWPAATMITLIALGITAIGLAVEIALVFTLFACSNNPFVHYSTSQSVFLCGVNSMTVLDQFPALGPWYAYILFIIPLCLAWIAFICMLILYIAWAKGDDYFFDD